MLDRIPLHIDPVNFADKGKTLLGAIKINELTRLSEILLDNSGEIELDLSFDREGRVPVLEGKIKANLALVCQSCLEQVVLSIDKHFKLGFVLSIEQADRLPSDCEPMMLHGGKISLNELVEDELLLALPDFPRHSTACIEQEYVNDEEVLEEENVADEHQAGDSNNPFSVLAKLKNTGD